MNLLITKILMFCLFINNTTIILADDSIDLVQCYDDKATELYHTSHAKNYSFLSTAGEVVQLNFPGMWITCVKAISNWRDGTGGKAYLTDGGLNTSSVTIQLESQFSRGYSTTVTIKGVPVPTSTTNPSTTPSPSSSPMDMCVCNNHCQGNMFDDRIFVPTFVFN